MVMGTRALVTAFILLLSGSLCAFAAELKLDSTSVTEDGPRVTLHLRFSGEVKYESVAQYAKNQYILKVPGLVFSKQQLKGGLAIGQSLGGAVRGGAYEAREGYGEIRLQLNKGLTPGDVQLIPREKSLDLQFVIPGKASAPSTFVADEPAAQATAANPARSNPVRGDALPTQVEGDATDPLVSLTGQTFLDPPLTIAATEPGLTTEMAVNSEQAADESAADPDGLEATESTEPNPIEPAPETGSGYSPDELAEFSGLRNTGSEQPADAQPEAAAQVPEPNAVDLDQGPEVIDREVPSTPSYKRFDLDQVPAKQIEIRDLRFREALLQLVAGSGFNVVVGDDIDNDTVYLNFKNKQISLKEALETLCIAYQLAYSVEDGAIVITRQ
jgi:hypothetical protein